MEGAQTAASAIDFTPLKDALTSAITPAQLITTLASVVGIGIAFVLAWFGIRKAVGAFTTAVNNGRLKV